MDPTAHQYIKLNRGGDLQGFRQALRILVWSDIPPHQISWSTHAEPAQFGSQEPAAYGAAGKPIILPRCVGELIGSVVRHSDPEKYALLYDLVWRMRRPRNPEPRLYEDASDPLVHRLQLMDRDVRRDLHNLHTSLRFRQADDPKVGEHFVAWFEPEHFVVETAAQVFVARFASMVWTILTPKGSLHWDKRELWIGPPVLRGDAPDASAFESCWRTFCESVFNPARTNLQMTRQLMPKEHWKSLPKTPGYSRSGPNRRLAR